MEKKLLLVVVVGMLSAVAFAGGPLGPPMSVLDHGQWAFDIAYFYEEMNLWGCGTEQYREGEYSDPNWSWSSWDSDTTKFKLEDFKTNTWLGSLEYGLCDNWDVYLRLGAADAEADLIFWGESEGEKADFGYGPAWQIGTNFTICQSGPWTFGGRMQIGASYPDDWEESWADTIEDYNAVGNLNAELNWWQGMAYLGATCQVNEAFQCYTGVGWQSLQGSLDWTVTSRAYDPNDTLVGGEDDRGTNKVKHNSAIGVFGAVWTPRPQTNVSVELLVGEAGKWGIGVMGSIPIP